jgi:hypothetical protein
LRDGGFGTVWRSFSVANTWLCVELVERENAGVKGFVNKDISGDAAKEMAIIAKRRVDL